MVTFLYRIRSTLMLKRSPKSVQCSIKFYGLNYFFVTQALTSLSGLAVRLLHLSYITRQATLCWLRSPLQFALLLSSDLTNPAPLKFWFLLRDLAFVVVL